MINTIVIFDNFSRNIILLTRVIIFPCRYDENLTIHIPSQHPTSIVPLTIHIDHVLNPVKKLSANFPPDINQYQPTRLKSHTWIPAWIFLHHPILIASIIRQSVYQTCISSIFTISLYESNPCNNIGTKSTNSSEKPRRISRATVARNAREEETHKQAKNGSRFNETEHPF